MDDRKAVREAYDELADHYNEQTQRADGEPPEPVERFCAQLDQEDRLLDAGCGGGDHPLVEAGETAVGLDFSREQLHTARELAPAELVQGDMTALPFAADSFDAVAALYSLIHVPLDRHRAVLEEFARVLRSGGTLLVSEGGVEWRGANPDWMDSGTEMQWSMAGPEATRADLTDCGFTIRGKWDVTDPIAEDDEKPFFLADLSAE